ncbi:MAG TPA: MBL fold metallo-hydrolase [Abditibacteriaceae bacterium]|jgi:phosphoribosyl 1,2-cyclic phosphodiesterase
MQVRFWGVRGSIPAPLHSEQIAARIEDALRRFATDPNAPPISDAAALARWVNQLPPTLRATTGGNTSCVEMRTDAGDIFIIDMGSGLRPLGNALMNEGFGQGMGHARIFLSHYHWDHIQGWPFFKPSYVPGNKLEIFTRHDDLETRLRSQQTAPFFPSASWDDMHADIAFQQMNDEPLVLCDGRVRVTTIELEHPSRAWAYRFEADGKVFVYASDSSYHHPDREAVAPYLNFYRDADLLIFDAQFTLVESYEKRTWGHSSAVIGVELACEAGVKNLALYHHDPGADDETLENLLQAAHEYSSAVPCPSNCRLLLAREGLTIDL